MTDSAWAEALNKKRGALERAKINVTNSVTDLDTFEASLNSIAETYIDKTTSSMVREKLTPHLDHVASFTKAISVCTQGNSCASLVWGSLLVVIEFLDDVMAELADLQYTLPRFTEYLELYQSDATLQLYLRSLYEDYLDFCICLVKYVHHSPALNIIRNFVSSSHIKGLRSIKAAIRTHKERFEERAEIAHRRNVAQTLKETRKLSSNVSSNQEQLVQRLSPDSNAGRMVTSGTSLTLRNSTNAGESSWSSPSFIHTITWKRNQLFSGRVEQLQLLHKSLSNPNQIGEPVSCAIHGMGGVGKTQLALEYTYRYRSYYQAIFWLRTENSVELMKSFAAIGNKLNIIDDVNTGRRNSRIFDWLENTDLTWLLIMDNLDKFDIVATIWPTSVKKHGAIIITTQTPCDTVRWTDYDIPLKPMDSHEGSEMLLAQAEIVMSDNDIKRQEELAKEISLAVGGLPLWISHLSGFIAQSQCTLEECLEIYRSSSGILDEQHHRDRWMYDKYPGAVFDLAFSKLHEDAKSLLNILAFLNPDGVPERMLLVDVPDENFEFLRPCNRQRFLNAIASLRNSHLTKREGSREDTYLTTHRSLQRVVLHKLDQDPPHREIFFERACFLLRRVFPRPSPLQQPESEKWPQIETYLPQLLTLESAFLRAQPPIKGSLEFAVLLSSIGLNVWDRGLSNDAKSLMLTAEKVLDNIGWDRWAMERSDIYVILGILTDTVGITQRVEGLHYREKALQVRQHYVDTIPQADMTLEEEIRYYNALTDRMCSWQQFNRYEDIERYCNIVIEKYKSWGKETDFPYEFAKFYHHMAYVFVYRGETTKAVHYAQHASKLLRMGNFGLLGVLFRFDCATVMFQAGQTEEAISEHEKVLEHRLMKLGRSNLMTLQSFLMLGVIYYTLQDFSKAKPHLSEVVAQCRQRTLYHEIEVRAKFYMGLTLKKSPDTPGDKATGEALVSEAKAAVKELLAHDFPAFLQGCSEYDPALFDYVAPWTYRIAVERQDVG